MNTGPYGPIAPVGTTANVVCETRFLGNSVIHRLDPRVRIVVACAFSVLVAVSTRFPVIGAGLALAVGAVLVARLPAAPTLGRLAKVNLFMLFIFLVLPLTSGGTPLFHAGPLTFSREGVLRAAAITLKSNSIVLGLTALLSTVEVVKLGHAFAHLRVPDKLTHLFLFTVRYADVLHHEYERLVRAMKVRCFRPGMNLHTYRSVGCLVGMLLVKSFDRSDRISAAMRCRGFDGKFYVLDHFAVARRDIMFCAVSCLALAGLMWAEWL